MLRNDEFKDFNIKNIRTYIIDKDSIFDIPLILFTKYKNFENELMNHYKTKLDDIDITTTLLPLYKEYLNHGGFIIESRTRRQFKARHEKVLIEFFKEQLPHYRYFDSYLRYSYHPL